MKNHDRQIALLCPTCGGDQFAFDKSQNESIEMAKCASCGRELGKDDLIAENQENIFENAKEMGEEIIKDFAAETRRQLKQAFPGSKNIKFK